MVDGTDWEVKLFAKSSEEVCVVGGVRSLSFVRLEDENFFQGRLLEESREPCRSSLGGICF